MTAQAASDLATCVCALDSSVFACGTHSGQVALWDSRQPGTPAHMLTLSDGVGRGQAGMQCLSTLAVRNELVLGGTLSGTVALWDRRCVPCTQGLQEPGTGSQQCACSR